MDSAYCFFFYFFNKTSIIWHEVHTMKKSFFISR